jgi:hypothetical protein
MLGAMSETGPFSARGIEQTTPVADAPLYLVRFGGHTGSCSIKNSLARALKPTPDGVADTLNRIAGDIGYEAVVEKLLADGGLDLGPYLSAKPKSS